MLSARWSKLPEEDTTEVGSSSRALGSMKLLRGPFLMTENYGETFSALHMASHLLKKPTLRCKVPASYTFHLYPAHFCPTTSKGSAPGLPHWELTTLRKIFQHYIFQHTLCVNWHRPHYCLHTLMHCPHRRSFWAPSSQSLKGKQGKEIIVSATARAIGPISSLMGGDRHMMKKLTRLHMGNTHHF